MIVEEHMLMERIATLYNDVALIRMCIILTNIHIAALVILIWRKKI